MEIIIKKLKEKSFIFHLITIFIFSMKIIFSDCNCNLNTPIRKYGNCQLTYCTEEEYKNEICIIDNDKSNIKERKEKIIINFSGGFDSLSL